MSFKVWSGDRRQKYVITIVNKDRVYANLLEKACMKLKIDGTKLVLETDGTVIDDDDSLFAFKKDTFLLLAADEEWKSVTSSEPGSDRGNDENMEVDNLDADMGEEIGNNLQQPNQEVPRAGGYEIDNQLQGEGILEVPVEDVVGEYVLQQEDPLLEDIRRRKESFTTWNDYVVPWNTFNHSAIQKCLNGTQDPATKSDLVQLVLGDMRFYEQVMQKKDFEHVARQIIRRFPETFEDRDDTGARMGHGYESVLGKLQHANNFKNRTPKDEKNLIQVLGIKIGKQRLKRCLMAGTVDWQPSARPHGETDQTLDQKRLQLNSINLDSNLSADILLQAGQDLNATYATQRSFLNNLNKMPTHGDIKNRWSCLLTETGLSWHFTRLTRLNNVDSDEFRERLINKTPRLLAYGFAKKMNPLPATIPEEIRCLEAMKMISKHFKEESNTMFIKFPDTTQFRDIVPPVSYPCIVIHEGGSTLPAEAVEGGAFISCGLRPTQYWIAFDSTIISNLCTIDFKEALEWLIQTYFNFNRMYPKDHAGLLMFIQMYLCKMYTPNESRASEVKYHNSVISFYRKLNRLTEEDITDIHTMDVDEDNF